MASPITIIGGTSDWPIISYLQFGIVKKLVSAQYSWAEVLALLSMATSKFSLRSIRLYRWRRKTKYGCAAGFNALIMA
jgi:hypothetical protein